MPNVIKRVLATSLFFCFFCFFCVCQQSFAFMLVTDLKNIAETASVVVNTAEEVKKEIQVINNQLANLKQLQNGLNFTGLNNNFTNQINQLTDVLNTTQHISFQMNNITSEYQRLFPSSTDWPNKKTSDYDSYYKNWSDQLHEASLASMKSQATLNNVAVNNQQAQKILSQMASSDSAGEVKQLQSIGQLLGVVSNHLSDLTTTTATAGRLMATAAAKDQAQDDAARALMKEFTDVPRLDVNQGESFGRF